MHPMAKTQVLTEFVLPPCGRVSIREKPAEKLVWQVAKLGMQAMEFLQGSLAGAFRQKRLLAREWKLQTLV